MEPVKTLPVPVLTFSEWIIASLLILLVISIFLNILLRRKYTFLLDKNKKVLKELESARDKENFLNDIIAHFNDYLFYHDMEGNFLQYDPTHQKKSDYSQNDIRRMNLRDIVIQPYRGEVNDYLQRIRETGSDSGYINIVNRHNESVVLEYMCCAIYNQTGTMVGAKGISRDITDAVEARRALRKSEKKYRTILESIEEGYYEVDMKGNYLFFNSSVCQILGYPPDELQGMNYREIVHPDYQQSVFSTFNWVYRSGKPVKTFDWKVLRKDNTTCYIETSVSLFTDESGRPAGFQGIFRDVTPRIEALQKRKELEEQLHHAQKMESIGTLAGGIAHDFNNILFPIMGYTEMAIDDTYLCTKTRENLEKVLTSAHRARGLVEQILNFSRQSGSGERDTQPVMIQPVLKETLKLLEKTLPSNIEIRPEISNETGKVTISSSQIHQVIMNLCTNAYQAMEECISGILCVRLCEAEISETGDDERLGLTPGSYVLLSVSDTGCGIDPDVKEKIFEPYFSTKPPEKGTGLGLAVCYRIIRNAGGVISVESTPGKGSCFHMYLPLSTEPATREHPENLYDPHGLPRGSERILLVDDEYKIVDVQKQMLENLGYHVTGTTESKEALQIITRRPEGFDLVLTDQAMPEMTGITLATHICSINPKIPVILCTGYSDKGLRTRASEAGIVSVLQKPITQKDLATSLQSIINRHRRANEDAD